MSSVSDDIEERAEPICIKRKYADLYGMDGKRILIDRLWPHGVSHTLASPFAWGEEIAPGDHLRCRFRFERDAHPDPVSRVAIHAAKSGVRNRAPVLHDHLRK